ncbi:MAG: septum formation protein Maf [Nitrospiraceae bacterium]|nr:septum formation protein Maf [Nitrospiraceae bacterium]
MQLVLASTSPRRRELLQLLGVSFVVCAPAFDEDPIAGVSPRDQAARFAEEKALSVARHRSQDVVLGSDTVIELDGTLLGKPVDLAEARSMLMRLAGRTHYVHTAVACCGPGSHTRRVETATAIVVMKPANERDIDAYLDTTESLGKAGAYSIQGRGGLFIDHLDGDFTTVVGLPLKVVAGLLTEAGHPVPSDIDALYQRRPYPNWNRFPGQIAKEGTLPLQ